MEQINVVLVDDHQLFLEGLKATLSANNTISVIQTFNDAQKALEFLKVEKVDLVITDISMPNLNGIEFIKRLKNRDATLKIMAISMFKPVHYEKGFYDGYLLKDTDSSIVIKAIKSIVLEEKPYFFDENLGNETLSFSQNIVTKREKEVIVLIAKEYTVGEIATALFLSKHTVETHKKNIFFKLQVKTNTGLIKKAIQLGYISS